MLSFTHLAFTIENVPFQRMEVISRHASRLGGHKRHISSPSLASRFTTRHASTSKQNPSNTSPKPDSYGKAPWIQRLLDQKAQKSRELTETEREAFLARREQRLQQSRT